MSHLPLSIFRILRLLPAWIGALAAYAGRWCLASLVLALRLTVDVPWLMLRGRLALQPRLATVAEDQLPDDAWIFLNDASEALTSAGFTSYGTFSTRQLLPQTTLWLRLLAHHEQGIVASIVYAASAPVAETFAEFSSSFAAGRLLITHNRRRPYPLPAPHSIMRVTLPAVADPHALYVLHRDLVASLPHAIQPIPIAQAARHPACLFLGRYAQELQALTTQGWLRCSARLAHLRLRGAAAYVYRQAWVWAGAQVRREQRRAYALLAAHGLDIEAFTGAAAAVVERYPFHATPGEPLNVASVYERVRSVARRCDANATLEGVLVDLASHAATPHRFYYTFRSSDRHYQRRIHRLRRFDIHLDPQAGVLAVTAMQRAVLRAKDSSEWQAVANLPLATPLRLGPWLVDLDKVLSVAWESLNAQANGQSLRLDSALLCNDPTPCWRVIAQTVNPRATLSVIVNAYTGAIKGLENE